MRLSNEFPLWSGVLGLFGKVNITDVVFCADGWRVWGKMGRWGNFEIFCVGDVERHILFARFVGAFFA